MNTLSLKEELILVQENKRKLEEKDKLLEKFASCFWDVIKDIKLYKVRAQQMLPISCAPEVAYPITNQILKENWIVTLQDFDSKIKQAIALCLPPTAFSHDAVKLLYETLEHYLNYVMLYDQSQCPTEDNPLDTMITLMAPYNKQKMEDILLLNDAPNDENYKKRWSNYDEYKSFSITENAVLNQFIDSYNQNNKYDLPKFSIKEKAIELAYQSLTLLFRNNADSFKNDCISVISSLKQALENVSYTSSRERLGHLVILDDTMKKAMRDLVEYKIDVMPPPLEQLPLIDDSLIIEENEVSSHINYLQDRLYTIRDSLKDKFKILLESKRKREEEDNEFEELMKLSVQKKKIFDEQLLPKIEKAREDIKKYEDVYLKIDQEIQNAPI